MKHTLECAIDLLLCIYSDKCFEVLMYLKSIIGTISVADSLTHLSKFNTFNLLDSLDMYVFDKF